VQSTTNEKMDILPPRRSRIRSPWSASLLTICVTALSLLLGYTIVNSFLSRQLDPKGCEMCRMAPSYARIHDFDTEHTRLASKYSLYLYREWGIDQDTHLNGVPVLFITGNAGSYKQVRMIGAESARYYAENVQDDAEALADGSRNLDWFSADFNEDFTAFHGQTLLDQAEYLNDAIAYILSMYHDPNRSRRDPGLPDPTSVIVVGHSMGGIVARTMLNTTNYQANSINTIITMSSPHARAPLPFDSDIVNIYDRVNNYWRDSYAQKWASDNPLWHVTLVSIAGGGLDNIVPSDYASIASLVPNTHGFTVFTSSVPDVWTGADHLSILWCDQFRKVVARSILDVVDVRRASQTKPRADRMRIFKKRYLTGMEAIAERSLPQQEPSTLLTLEDNSNAVMAPGERLALRQLGISGATKAHLLPIPANTEYGGKRFTLLTDQILDQPGGEGKLEVLLCSVSPTQPGKSEQLFAMNIDLSGTTPGSTRLACKTAVADVIKLPASYPSSKYSFDLVQPFSYLQYDFSDIADHQYVAVIDKAKTTSPGWVVAQFADWTHSRIEPEIGLRSLLLNGFRTRLPAERPLVTEVNIPAAYSSLLTYRFTLSTQTCSEDRSPMFSPLLRQHISEPFESKYFPNARNVEISMHGIAPFMPPPMRGHSQMSGLNMQLWSDPTCESSMDLVLEVDWLGSLGKLWMRYRTVFPALPILIAAVVLRKQFTTHDKQGVFITFMEALDIALRRNLPALILCMTVLAVEFASGLASDPNTSASSESFSTSPELSANSISQNIHSWQRNATETFLSFTRNDLLLGQADPFFWFLMPLFGLISIGATVVLNYVALLLTAALNAIYVFISAQTAWVYNTAVSSPSTSDRFPRGRNAGAPGFYVPSPRRRIIVTAFLVLAVATVIPYPFAYMVACIVQLATCVRALRLSQETRASQHANYYNYAHSILILMLLILPINGPVLIVWVHNLAVHWLTPFSSHHNIFSILPFILLVEIGTSGKMIPRVRSSLRLVTSLMFFGMAVYAGVYGVTYAYQLHHIANIICAWLVVLHFTDIDLSWSSIQSIMIDGSNGGGSMGSLGFGDAGPSADPSRLLKKRP